MKHQMHDESEDAARQARRASRASWGAGFHNGLDSCLHSIKQSACATRLAGALPNGGDFVERVRKETSKVGVSKMLDDTVNIAFSEVSD